METPMLTLKNRTLYHGDNLQFLRTIPTGTIDLIATDPPFNKGHDFVAAERSQMEGMSFPDKWTWDEVEETWVDILQDDKPKLATYILAIRDSEEDWPGTNSVAAFMCWMGVRLLEMHRILKDTGSLYLHIDWEAHAYVKVLLDHIFGKANFRNEIAWCYSGPANVKRWFPRKHDNILFYTKGDNYPFEVQYTDYKRLTGTGKTSLARGGRTEEEVKALEAEYQERGKPLPDYWTDIGAGGHMPKDERTGYPTQKPLKLMRRIIQASSKQDDLVLDPFSGSGTTLIAAENLGRRWIGADQQKVNLDLIRERLEKFVDITAKVSEEERVSLKAIEDGFGKDSEVYQTLVKQFAERQAVTILTPEHLEPYQDYLNPASAYQEQSLKGYTAPRPRNLVRTMTKKEMKDILLNRLGLPTCCWACGFQPPVGTADFLELDHLHPHSKGGSDSLENRAILCRVCNGEKGNRLTFEELVAKNQKANRWYWNTVPGRIITRIRLEDVQEAVQAYLANLEANA